MSLNSGLFEHQEQSEQDLTEGPGWTIDQEKPTFWSGFGPTAAIRGLGQGAADGYALLTGALHNNLNYKPPANYATMTDAEREQSVDTQKMPEDWASEQSKNALTYAKTLTPDPRVTGTAANLLQGFSKAASLFTVGNLAGGPAVGAGVLGYSEGYARYHDLLDQGVDEETAHNAASLEGAASAAGALMPFSLPAKWLASMSGAGELLTQLGAGATINTAFGAAQRYGSAKILTDAGHPELADQAAVWDKTNLMTDALTGLFFGAHGALHDRKIEGQEAMRGVLRDAAKVVQDRQAILDRAPGVPVNMESQAIHKAALETALTDLLQDKPVSLNPHDVENAVFARPAENGELPRNIIREEFLRSGVLDSAEDIDRWLRGETEPRAEEAITPKAETETPEGETKVADDETPPERGPLATRPDLKIVDEDGTERPAAEALDQAKDEAAQGNAEADKIFTAAAACGARFG